MPTIRVCDITALHGDHQIDDTTRCPGGQVAFLDYLFGRGLMTVDEYEAEVAVFYDAEGGHHCGDGNPHSPHGGWCRGTTIDEWADEEGISFDLEPEPPAMHRRRWHHRPARQCEIVDNVPGPHPGCAEFAPPEVIVCTEPATHIAKLAPDQYDPTPTKLQVCTWHATRGKIAQEPTARIYRFRRIGA